MSITSSNSYIRWSPFSIWDEWDDERKVIVLRLTKLHRGEGIYLNFDNVASNLWRLLNGTRNAGRILEDFNYIEKSKSLMFEHLVLEVLEQFLDLGLIELSCQYLEIPHARWKGHEYVHRPNYVNWHIDDQALVLLNNSTNFLTELGPEYLAIWHNINGRRTVNEITSQLTVGHQQVDSVLVRLRLRYLDYFGIILVRE